MTKDEKLAKVLSKLKTKAFLLTEHLAEVQNADSNFVRDMAFGILESLVLDIPQECSFPNYDKVSEVGRGFPLSVQNLIDEQMVRSKIINFEKLKIAHELIKKAERTLGLTMITESIPFSCAQYILTVDKYSGDQNDIAFDNLDDLIETISNFSKQKQSREN